MKKIALALALGCLLLPKSLLADGEKNLWYNPGFEELQDNKENMPKRWNIPLQLHSLKQNAPLVKENPHEGKHCIELSPGGARVGIWDDKYDFDQKFDAKEGDIFEVSYWHRGNMIKPTMAIEVRYYGKSGGYSAIHSRTIPNSMVQTQTEWRQHTVKFKISKEDLPEAKRGEEIAFIDIKFYVPTIVALGKDPGSIFLDDLSLTKKEPKPEIILTTPTVKGRSYQREIELAWDKGLDNEVSWEIVVNGGEAISVKEPNYTITALTPNTSYKVKVRTVKEKITSAYSEELTIKTEDLDRTETDETRLPYLRTLSPEGTTNQTIKLFYNDLYHASQAKFTYWIDGQEVAPKGYLLTAPKKGKQELKVRIEETPTQVWILTYNLDII